MDAIWPRLEPPTARAVLGPEGHGERTERAPFVPNPRPRASGPEGRKTIAHGVSRGWTWVMGLQPQRGDRTHSPRNLAPLRGWFPFASGPTAHAVGYHLPVLRTSCPADPHPTNHPAAASGPEERPNHTPHAANHLTAVPGPEGRKTIAHGVSRGWTWGVDPQPQRGDRNPKHFFPLLRPRAILGSIPSAKAGGHNPDRSAPTWHGTDLYPAPEPHRFQHQGTSPIDDPGPSRPVVPLHGRHHPAVGGCTHPD